MVCFLVLNNFKCFGNFRTQILSEIHQEYWIDHEEQNYSEGNFGWDQLSEIFHGMLRKSIFFHHGGKTSEMGVVQIHAASAGFKVSPF